MRYYLDMEIKDISPAKIEAYLTHKGWEKRKEVQGIASIWSTPFQDREANMLLPLNQEYGDFEYRLEEAIKILAIVEGRSPAKTISAVRRYHRIVVPDIYPLTFHVGINKSFVLVKSCL